MLQRAADEIGPLRITIWTTLFPQHWACPQARERWTNGMKMIIRGIMIFSALASALTLTAQTADTGAPTADEIVGKYVAAVGGKDAIAQVKSISMEATMQVMGNEAPSTTVVVDGVGRRVDTDFNGTKIIQCINSKGGWTVNPMAGAADPTPMSDDEYNSAKDDIYVSGGLYDYAAHGATVELVSKDAEGYKIKLTSKDKAETTFVIDPATFLIKSVTRKGSMQGQEVDVTTTFSDYRKTDLGYLMPYAMDIDFGGQFQLSMTIKKVELNKTVDPAIFELPKPETPAPASPTAG